MKGEVEAKNGKEGNLLQAEALVLPLLCTTRQRRPFLLLPLLCKRLR